LGEVAVRRARDAAMEIPIGPETVPPWRRASGSLGQMLARAADGTFAMLADGKIVSWNPAAEGILGYSDREVVGLRCCELLDAWDEQGRRVDCRGCHVRTRVRKGDPVQSFDALVRHKAGRRIRINVSTLVAPHGGRVDDPLTVHLFHEVTSIRDLPNRAAEPRPGVALAASVPRLLTPRETEVVRLLIAGATSRTIAVRLNVSTATVRNHVQHILVKLGAHSRLEVVAYALRHQLL
jgi:PAS domain S-box-containing protein